jgi:hypothetical protein
MQRQEVRSGATCLSDSLEVREEENALMPNWISQKLRLVCIVQIYVSVDDDLLVCFGRWSDLGSIRGVNCRESSTELVRFSRDQKR